MEETTLIWIVGPHFLYNQAIIGLFERFPNLKAIGHTANITNWTESLPNPQVDIILFNLPDLKHLSDLITQPLSPTAVCVALDWTTKDIDKAFSLGIIGCIAGDSTIEEFLSIVRQALKGEPAVSSKLATQIFLEKLPSESSQPPIKYDDLSPREKDVLSLLCQGLSNKQIAQSLYLSVRTVDNHVSNLFSKLNVNSRTEAAVISINLGWVKTPKIY